MEGDDERTQWLDTDRVFKNKVIAKLLPPNTASLEEISREVGVSIDTLERWRAESLTMPARERAWSAGARLNAVITTAAMDESSCSAWCRENSVYPQELDAWQASATQVLAEPQEQRARFLFPLLATTMAPWWSTW